MVGHAITYRIAAGPNEAEKRTLRIATPLLKYVLARKAAWACREGVEVLGGNGYIEDWPLARVLRDAQVLPIWEGTTNILVLDTFRAIRKETAHEMLFAEVEHALGDAPDDVAARCGGLLDELKHALVELRSDPASEHRLRDWTDRAALLWAVSLSASKAGGFGTDSDLRAARRVLARHVPTGLLRRDGAGVAELEAIVFA